MSNLLRPWEQGRSFDSQFTARRMNDLQRAIKPVRYSGFGLRVSHFGDQAFVTTARPRIAPSNNIKFPFQITPKPDPANPGQFLAQVNTDSTVMKSLKPDDNLTVTGLGTDFPFIANDVIALYIVVSQSPTPYAAVSATIQSYGAGTTTFDPTLGPWNPIDNSFVFDDGGTPPKQIGINILLGYSTPDLLGNPYFVQAQTTHMLLENCDINGKPAIYDFSHRERYGITAP